MVHWYHLAVAIGKGPGNSTWEDGSACDGTVSFPDLGREPFNGSAPVIMYGPACGKPVATAADADSRLGARSGAGVGDAPRVEVALPQDATDPYLTTWVKTQPGPVGSVRRHALQLSWARLEEQSRPLLEHAVLTKRHRLLGALHLQRSTAHAVETRGQVVPEERHCIVL